MERNTCPVCGKNLNKQGQCPECGYDFSADAEQFDTLSSKLSEKQKTKTRLREQTSILNGVRESDDVVVSVNSSGLAKKKGLQPALVLAAVAVLLVLAGAFGVWKFTTKVPEPQTSAEEETFLPFDMTMTSFDYAYSDDPADNAKYTAKEFAEVVKSENVRELLPLGTRIKMIPNSKEITDEFIEFELVAYKHFEQADGSGMAKTTWLAVNLLNETRAMNGEWTNAGWTIAGWTNAGGWRDSEMRGWLNETLYPSLPSYWKNLMVRVAVSSTAGNQSKEIVTSADYLFLPAAGEMHAWYLESSNFFVFYSSEISSDAEEQTFIRFTDGNVTRVKKRQGNPDFYWLRSPSVSSAAYFNYVNSSGSSGNYFAGNSYGVCPGFCM